MYYLLEQKGKCFIKNKPVDVLEDKVITEMSDDINVMGMFGEKDVAEKWRDYYNGVISREELNKFLWNKKSL